MLRRLLAVAAGLATCQVSMIVCLALSVGLMYALQPVPIVALLGVAMLLAVPGLAGGGLAGFLTDQYGGLYGAAATSLFGGSVALVKLFVAPLVGYTPGADDLPLILYIALIGVLCVCGAIGGTLGHRRRSRRQPASAQGV